MKNGIGYGRWASKSQPSLQNLPKDGIHVKVSEKSISELEERVLAAKVMHLPRGHSKDWLTQIAVDLTKNGGEDDMTAIYKAWFNSMSYTPPKPHCKALVDDIIDSFWSNTNLGLYGQLIEHMDVNPKSKDIFKGKSTSHHYPWYKRGSKY